MEPYGKFKSTSTDKSIRDMIRDIEENVIELNPKYQRKGTIWSLENKSDFIDSVYTGIVPSRILYNINKKHRYICIDGKQRITTLVEFNYFVLLYQLIALYLDLCFVTIVTYSGFKY